MIFPLPEILLPVLGATLAGADDGVEAGPRGGEHLAFIASFPTPTASPATAP